MPGGTLYCSSRDLDFGNEHFRRSVIVEFFNVVTDLILDISSKIRVYPEYYKILMIIRIIFHPSQKKIISLYLDLPQ